jgi:hypothetical protein
MMNPVHENLERYFWGEFLPIEQELACEKLVAEDHELRKNFHQVSQLKRRFEMLKEHFKRSEELQRTQWLIRSKAERPIPSFIREDVRDVIESLQLESCATKAIHKEIIRRIGHIPVKRTQKPEAETVSEMMDSLDVSMSYSIPESSRRYIDYDDMLGKAKKGQIDRLNAVNFVEERYPEVVYFMRHHFNVEYKRWRNSSRYSYVLSPLEFNKPIGRVKAAIEIIDIAGKTT